MFHFHLKKTISEYLKQQLSNTITDNQQYDVYKWPNDVICRIWDTACKWSIAPKGSSNRVKHLLSWSTFPKNQVSGLKTSIKWSNSEKWENDVLKWRHTSETGYDIKKDFQNVSLMMVITLKHDESFLKTKSRYLKQRLLVKLAKTAN